MSFPVHLNKLSDVVKNNFAKKDVRNTKIKNTEDKIPDITNLAADASLNAKINQGKWVNEDKWVVSIAK